MRQELIVLLSAAMLVALIGAPLRLRQDLALAQSGGDYDVEWSVMGSAGDQFVSGGDHQMGFTLAQDTPPLVSTGGSYQIAQGYWAIGEDPYGTVIAIRGFAARPTWGLRGPALLVGLLAFIMLGLAWLRRARR